MRRVILLFTAITFLPVCANACGGGTDIVGLSVLVALTLLSVPAFIIPAAGILSLPLQFRGFFGAAFLAYAVILVAVVVLEIRLRPNDVITAINVLVFAAMLIAPSVHYGVAAYRSSRLASPILEKSPVA